MFQKSCSIAQFKTYLSPTVWTGVFTWNTMPRRINTRTTKPIDLSKHSLSYRINMLKIVTLTNNWMVYTFNWILGVSRYSIMHFFAHDMITFLSYSKYSIIWNIHSELHNFHTIHTGTKHFVIFQRNCFMGNSI